MVDVEAAAAVGFDFTSGGRVLADAFCLDFISAALPCGFLAAAALGRAALIGNVLGLAALSGAVAGVATAVAADLTLAERGRAVAESFELIPSRRGLAADFRVDPDFELGLWRLLLTFQPRFASGKTHDWTKVECDMFIVGSTAQSSGTMRDHEAGLAGWTRMQSCRNVLQF